MEHRLAIAQSGASAGPAGRRRHPPRAFPSAAGGEGFAFVVAVVEPTGAETHLFGSVGGATMRAVFRERLAPRPGEVLRLTVEPSLGACLRPGDGAQAVRARTMSRPA